MTSRTRKPSIRRAVTLGATLTALLGAGLTAPAGAVDAPAATGTPTPAPAPADASTDLTIASFNVLGSSHTRGAGGYASGVRRTQGVVRLLAKHDVEIVGLQEMQADQMRSFRRRTDGAYAMYPGFSGARAIDGENSLAWDRSAWEAVVKRTFTIPYFHGNRRTMPLVKLRNLETGMTAWFANVHNPASTRQHGGSARWRVRAIRSEARLARRLHDTGIPVFLTGDMNEREQAFCPLTGTAPLQAARGGSHTDGTCRANDPQYVDWAFGSEQLDFSGYVEDRGAVNKRTSDHPIVVSDAHIDGSTFSSAVQP
ncbi:MAG: endonuclease/exonuclease/phosphatase family protein [Nocardioidaceae bacterium]